MAKKPERQWAWKLKHVEADPTGKWVARFEREHGYIFPLDANNQAQAEKMAADDPTPSRMRSGPS